MDKDTILRVESFRLETVDQDDYRIIALNGSIGAFYGTVQEITDKFLLVTVPEDSPIEYMENIHAALESITDEKEGKSFLVVREGTTIEKLICKEII